ncbi:unnamed protein product, partial [Amoebophrya sp. A25]
TKWLRNRGRIQQALGGSGAGRLFNVLVNEITLGKQALGETQQLTGTALKDFIASLPDIEDD